MLLCVLYNSMQGSFRKKVDYLLSLIKCYIKENKNFLFFHCLTLIAGLILGIIVCSLRSNISSHYNYIVLISGEEYNVFGVFIKVLLLAFLGCILCYLPIHHRLLSCMPYVTIFYTAYRLGSRIVGIIVVDKFIGFICILTFTLPLYFIILIGFVICSCISSHFKARGRKSCGVCKNIHKDTLKCHLIVCLAMLVGIVIVCIIIPSFAKFIIVV